jgi:hypothetical protein
MLLPSATRHVVPTARQSAAYCSEGNRVKAMGRVPL